MALTKVVLAKLSPTMEEGTIVKWTKNEGDPVKQGDVLAEIETDKANMEMEAQGSGVLRKILVPAGGKAPVGSLIGVIADPNEDISKMVAAAAAPAAAPAAPPQPPAQPQPAAPAQPQSAAPAPPQPAQPQQAQPQPAQPQQTQPQQTQPQPAPAQQAPPAAAPQPAAPPQPAPGPRPVPPPAEGGRLKASPLARSMAAQRNIPLDSVAGSGPGGRIIKRDIEGAPSQARPAAAAAAPRQAAAGGGGDFEDVALTQIRKTIARRLSESIGPVPTFYLTAEFDMSRVAEARAAMAAMGDEYKASFNDIILKAVATALRQHREVNAHWLGDRIRYYNRVHLGMAVATDDGLIVPVIFDADQKSLREIAGEARELAKRARDRKLTPEQYTGATFSVSNLGMFGIDQFTAIINPPEAAILAIGAIEEKPVAAAPGAADGEVVTRPRLRVTMSCDHRVIDGAVGARFLQTLRRMLENPLMLVF